VLFRIYIKGIRAKPDPKLALLADFLIALFNFVNALGIMLLDLICRQGQDFPTKLSAVLESSSIFTYLNFSVDFLINKSTG